MKTPRPYQKEAIDAVVKGFETADRGQLIMACGTGKTLCSLWIYERISPNHTLVLVPSLQLLKQIKNEWLNNLQETVPYLCVCSDQTINFDNDEILYDISDIDSNVTTDPIKIYNFLINNKRTIIFSTYHSLEKIIISLDKNKFNFDFAICDEAHRTASPELGNFTLVHNDDLLPVKKRLYMTATPKIWNQTRKKMAKKEEIVYVSSMDNPSIFGYEFYNLSYKQAIDLNLLVNYKIVAVGINDNSIKQLLNDCKYYDINTPVSDYINNFALNKFIQEYNPNHTISFHANVLSAISFTERHKLFLNNNNIFHINGTYNSEKREKIFKEFLKKKNSIITNARCLGEGVDLPDVDAIYFSDPKKSKVEIIQAIGRALRLSTNKKICYIVIPLYHSSERDLKNSIDDSNFKEIINVLRCLSSYDDKINDSIRNIRTYNRDRKHNLISTLNIEIIDDNKIQYENYLHNEIINNYVLPWRKFENAREYVRGLGLKNQNEWKEFSKSSERPKDIPTNPYGVYKNSGYIGTGDWLGTFSSRPPILNRDDYLTYEEAKKIVHKLLLKSSYEWRKNSNLIPENIPIYPHTFYKLHGWNGWIDFLGSNNLRKNRGSDIITFEEARKFVRTLNINSVKEWRSACKNNIIPKNIPSGASEVYKNAGWTSWPDFLGNNNTTPSRGGFLTYHDALQFALSCKFTSVKQWKTLSKNKLLPKGIPANPDKVYLNQGWESWLKFLGHNDSRGQNRKKSSSKDDSQK